MKNKRQRKILLLVILLLTVTVGFALLSTTLLISGTAGIKSNKWDIHWEKVVPNTESTVNANTPVIDTNKTKVSYEVTLELPGDYYEFNVDAKNDGTINGAISAIRHNVYESDGTTTATLPEYIKYSIVYEGTENAPTEGDILEAGEKQTYTIRIEYDKDAKILPDSDLTYIVVDEIDYEQTKESKNISGLVIDKDPNEPTLGCGNIGNEFCIGTECFNLLTCDDNKASLLAKYNLLVGNTCTGYSTIVENPERCSPIPVTTEGYGRQSPTAIGLKDDNYPSMGTLPFSSNRYSYWYQKVGNLGDPGIKYQGKVSDTGWNYTEYENYEYPLPYIYDENSDLYSYVQDYIEQLKSLGAPSSTTGRLLNYDEAELFECRAYSGSCGKSYDNPDIYGFINNTTFWGGFSAGASTYNDDYVSSSYPNGWSINTVVLTVTANQYKDVYMDNPDLISRAGIRPVIEVPVSLIKYDGWRLVNPSATTLTNQKWEYWLNGKVITGGWKELNDLFGQPQKYYFENGYVKLGWHEEDNKKYYLSTFDEGEQNNYVDARMLHDETKTIDGTSYTFDSNGVCTNCN